MKQMKPILWTVILLILHQTCFGQQLSKQVTDFITVPDSILLLKNVTVIDGTGNAVKYNQDILIQNRRIAAIGKTGKLKTPKNVRVIDATGKTVIPGLIMMHEHLFHAKPFFGMYKAVHMTNTFPQLYLAGGVTTMRTAGSLEASSDLNVKNLIDQGKRLGPTLNVSTPHIEREGLVGEYVVQLQSLYGDENIENWLNYWFDKGITSVKVYNNFTKDDLREIIRVAHGRNIKVTGHLCSITYREAAEMGIDNLEHSFMASTDFVLDKPENECVPGRQTLLTLDENDLRLLDLMNYLIEKNVTLTYTPPLGVVCNYTFLLNFICNEFYHVYSHKLHLVRGSPPLGVVCNYTFLSIFICNELHHIYFHH